MQNSYDKSTIPKAWLMTTIISVLNGNKQLADKSYIDCWKIHGIVCANIQQLCDRYQVIPLQQHDYQPKRSTSTNLLACVNDWTHDVNQGLPVDTSTNLLACVNDSTHAVDQILPMDVTWILTKRSIAFPFTNWLWSWNSWESVVVFYNG